MTTDISNWTLVDLVQRQATAHGEREFMSFEHGTTLTFASLQRDSGQLARKLASLGVGPGDRVMVMLKNRIEFMLTMVANPVPVPWRNDWATTRVTIGPGIIIRTVVARQNAR